MALDLCLCGQFCVFGSRVPHTQVHMLQECHVECLSNGVSLVGVENDLSAIVALLKR